MKKITFQNSFLAETAALLKEGQSVRIRINGESMFPFIRGGQDVVEIIPYKSGEPIDRWSCVFYEWNGHYMIHRYIGCQKGKYQMMGDGNLIQIEEVEANKISGLLKAIHHPDGSTQDCSDPRWIRKAEYWYRLRKVRRFLIPLIRKFIQWGLLS